MLELMEVDVEVENEKADEELLLELRHNPKVVKLELARRKTLKSFKHFFKAFPPKTDYVYGTHTIQTLDMLTKVMEDVESGVSRYICICMPFRHGKSDIASRRFPVWTLIKHPDWEYILTSYNYDLAADMSLDARKCYRSLASVYGCFISKERDRVGSWRVEDGSGGLSAAGLGGTITGRGAHILGIDDYIKNREEAESRKSRDSNWESFQSDLMTRLAPVHAVLIIANRWHEDDLVGRIIAKNTIDSDEYDPDFPVFDVWTFPAEKDGKWLFPERFSDSWYISERAFMGHYAWSAQALQDPKPRRGNLFAVDKVDEMNEMPEGLHWEWGVDLASSEKELVRDNPDFTVATEYAIRDRHIYIRDVVRGQWAVHKRDATLQYAIKNGLSSEAWIEVVGAYKDAWLQLRQALLGICVVRKQTVQHDLVARSWYLEPIFEAGHMHILKARWNRVWLDEWRSFPSGVKDDQIASLLAGTYHHFARKGKMGLSR